MDKDVFFVITTDCGKKETLFDLPFLIQEDGSFKIINHSLIPDKASLAECYKLLFVVKFSGCTKNKKGRRVANINGHQAGAFTAAYWATLQKYRYKISYRQLLDGIREYLNGKNPKKRTHNQYPQLISTRPITEINNLFKS